MIERFLGDQHGSHPATDPRSNKELAAAFNDKNVVIAGAGRGILRATAEFFAHTSAKSLSLMALELNEVDETASICKKINPDRPTKTTAFDVKDYSKAEEFIRAVDKEVGKVDVVFANTGRPP